MRSLLAVVNWVPCWRYSPAYFLLPIAHPRWSYGETAELYVFLESAGLSLATGLVLWLATRRFRMELRRVTATCWSASAGLPSPRCPPCR